LLTLRGNGEDTSARSRITWPLLNLGRTLADSISFVKWRHSTNDRLLNRA
jgi:hypothetical protein